MAERCIAPPPAVRGVRPGRTIMRIICWTTSHEVAGQIASQIEYARMLSARSVALLQKDISDPFLGRKTQEPFPTVEE